MSKPHYYWYGLVKRMITRYNDLLYEETDQALIFVDAIDRVFLETAGKSNGDLRVKAIKGILIDQTETVVSCAIKFSYHENVIKRWISQFVNDVGKAAGF